MQVRFWGVRGSCPAPLASDEIASRLAEALWRLGQDSAPPDLADREAIAEWVESLPADVRGCAGGNTPCVEMRTAAGELFIIDFGTGIRALGNELINTEFGWGTGQAHCFLSHYHWDHIQGWPFFKPTYVPGNRFDVYARHPSVEMRLRQQQQSPFFPPASWDDMQANIIYHQLGKHPITLCDDQVRVSSLELNHPSRSYAYRFEADGQIFVYASDGAYFKLTDSDLQPYVDFFRGADLLIFDAQFTLTESYEKSTWGHSSSVVGAELAMMAGVKRLALFHHDPSADDEALKELLRVGEQYAHLSAGATQHDAASCQILIAREGVSIDLNG
jgi:phosphoribosyl 1,2-cyclic phosphodiesterase